LEPLGEVPKDVPPVGVVYQAMVPPDEVPVRFDDPEVQMLAGVARTAVGTASPVTVTVTGVRDELEHEKLLAFFI
jgi:hypothetical protein